MENNTISAVGVKSGKNIGMMEAVFSVRREDSLLGHFDSSVRSYWDQWISERPLTRCVVSRRPRQISNREYCPIIRHARIAPTSTLSTIDTQLVPSLQAPVSVRTVARRLLKYI